MESLHGHRGQTATEYLGILVVVAAIVGALIHADVGHAIAGKASATICRIAQQDDCAEPDGGAPHATAPDGGPDSGPALGGPFPVAGLPWDGSVTAEGSVPGPGGTSLDASVTVSKSACSLGPDGTPGVDLSVSGTLQASAEQGVEGTKGASASASEYAGIEVAYGVSTDPTTAGQIQDGSRPTPTPVDPASIPEGTTLTLDQTTYAGLDLSAAYRGIQATMGYDRGHKVSAAVTRTDATHVSILVGDSDVVNQSGSLAVGTDSVNAGVAASRGLDSGRTKAVEIDLSTDAGRKAYADFLGSGQLPASGGAVSAPSDTRVITVSSEADVTATIGPVSGTLFAAEASGSVSQTVNPDGSESWTEFQHAGDVGVARTYDVGPDGKQGDSTYSIDLQDVDGTLVGNFGQAYGDANASLDGPSRDATLTLDDGQIEDLRTAAVRSIAKQPGVLAAGYSQQEVFDMLQADPTADLGVSVDPTLRAMAAAKDPTALVAAMANSANGDAERFANLLLDLQMSNRDLQLVPKPEFRETGCP